MIERQCRFCNEDFRYEDGVFRLQDPSQNHMDGYCTEKCVGLALRARDVAREEYCVGSGEGIEVDDEPRRFSKTECGVWVPAWLFVRDEELRSDEEEEDEP